ncbi:glycosyl hydrolase [Gramella sp. AN32]|uniref:Glycosyl hydrolase n=2 Tax=Christiangramia antarctica TaxID=2058158 RepID=A0ABW5XA87_9FLAO|nr:glycosyl hydrolase [Gramella sp. AN32]
MMKNYAFLIIFCGLISFQVSAQSPLEVFPQENYGGSSKQYEIFTPYSDLEEFDNNIKSFKLDKGYMVTFASNPDGTGYSRVYRADDANLEVTALPPYLNGTVSFIRVMTLHDYITKKGWAGWDEIDLNATNSTWYYDWSANGNTKPALEYVPIKQNLDWPGWGDILSNTGATHVLGYNEPDRSDQANISVETAIERWPNFMQVGLRLGSPATSDPFNGWLTDFMTIAEARNYRIDFIPIHAYWNKSAEQWSNDLDYLYNQYKRPIWITEWNIGANWTENSFPDDPEMITDANATKHKNDLIAVLEVLESKEFVERYSIYNWVQDARAVIATIDDDFKSRNPDWENYEWLKTAPVISSWDGGYKALTPAGEYYASLDSRKAYEPSVEYIPTWTPLKDSLSYDLSEDYQNITIKWEGINNDLVNTYIVERKLEGETEFSVFYESSDYTVLRVDDVVQSSVDYRIKVIGKDGAESVYSEILSFKQSETPAAPADLTGEAVSSSIINLSWTKAENAESYNLKRSNTEDGTYEIIASYVTETNYQDTGLNVNTTYYYKVSALNSGGESEESSPVSVKTNSIETPDVVSNILISSGDAQVKLKWDFIYDAAFYVKRSTSADGSFETIATVDTNEYTDSDVENGTTYFYKITAFNAEGESEGSSIKLAKPKAGQHLYYDFNENEGSNPHDQWGNYKGTLNSSVQWKPGSQDSGIYLDGSAESYMEIEEGMMENLSDFTISSWVKLESSQNWVRIFDFGSGTDTYMFLTPQNGSDGKYFFVFKHAGNEEFVTTNLSPELGKWVHVAVTLEGSTGIIYINGVEAGRNEAMTINPSMLGKTTQNYLGKSQWPDPNLDATIDDFKIYNHALEADKVAELAQINLSGNNFSIEVTGETCPGKNNGEISIVGQADLTYSATVNGTPYTFTDNTLILSDLTELNYDICIWVAEANTEQCYFVEVPESEDLTGMISAVFNRTHVEVTSGTAPYNVVINGILQFQTSQTGFDVSVKANDLLEIKSSKDCEGILSRKIILLDTVIASPNPSKGLFEISIPTESDQVILEIYNMNSTLISKKLYEIEEGKVSVNIENEPSGTYVIRVNSDPVETFRIIKK